jgi:hypothetical protein
MHSNDSRKSTQKKPTIHCAPHGDVPASAICKHLCEGRGLRYHAIDLPPEHPGVSQAWCLECQAALLKEGGWNDRFLAIAEFQVVCVVHYQWVIGLHSRVPLVCAAQPGGEEPLAKTTKGERTPSVGVTTAEPLEPAFWAATPRCPRRRDWPDLLPSNRFGIGRKTPGFEKLEAKLLSVGGTRVVIQPEADLDILLNRGRVFLPTARKTVEGVPHASHRNVALHYLQHLHLVRRGRCDIVTGYGLGEGMWVQHSWLWDGSRVVETNIDPELYFGVILRPDEAATFVLREVLPLLPGTADILGR